jgi:hypothetical protein
MGAAPQAREGKGKEGKSLLFLKKKKQKNFFHMVPSGGESRLQKDEVFLLLFVHKKKTLPATP